MSIAHATGRPIVMAGVGQGYEDLIPFDPSGSSTQSFRSPRDEFRRDHE